MGSEMCIRDRAIHLSHRCPRSFCTFQFRFGFVALSGLSLSWSLGGSIFGWLVSGEICRNPQRFRPKFYRQSSAVIQFCSSTCRRYTRRALQHFRFHFCIQRCAEISVEVLHSEFCRVLQKNILRSSAEKPSQGKLCGVFAIILQRFPLDSCMLGPTRIAFE